MLGIRDEIFTSAIDLPSDWDFLKSMDDVEAPSAGSGD